MDDLHFEHAHYCVHNEENPIHLSARALQTTCTRSELCWCSVYSVGFFYTCKISGQDGPTDLARSGLPALVPQTKIA